MIRFECVIKDCPTLSRPTLSERPWKWKRDSDGEIKVIGKYNCDNDTERQMCSAGLEEVWEPQNKKYEWLLKAGDDKYGIYP